MTDNVNVYMDNLLEFYTDMQNVIINPVSSPEFVNRDLSSKLSDLTDILDTLDNEFNSNVGAGDPGDPKDDDHTVNTIVRACGYINSVRIGIARFLMFTKPRDEDNIEIKTGRMNLFNTIMKYEALLFDKMQKFMLYNHITEID